MTDYKQLSPSQKDFELARRLVCDMVEINIASWQVASLSPPAPLTPRDHTKYRMPAVRFAARSK
jgi:hypothetical protein